MIISASQSGGVWRPVTAIPQGSLGVIAAPSGYTVAATSDFYSSSPPVVDGAITNIFTGSRTISPSFFGLTYHRWPMTGVTNPATSFKWTRTHDYGPGSARVRWSRIETTQGSFDWTALDSFVNYHYAAGHDIIHTLFGSPSWASARPSEPCSYNNGEAAEPSSLTYWDNYCAACATRYSGRIKYYEIWNEPNLTSFYTGTQTILSQMTRRANQTIKGIDAAAKIISSPVTTLWNNGQTYFSSMMTASDGAASNMAAWVDYVGVHLYPTGDQGIKDIPTLLTTFLNSFTGLGLSGKQAINTEVGALSPAYQTFSSQSDRLARIARIMLASACSGAGCLATVWYDGDNDSVLGLFKEDEIGWNNLIAILTSGPITVVNVLRDGRYTAVINGINYIF